jgi:hypothetical protein
MPRIEYLNYNSASTEVQQAYDKQKASAGGYVTNMKNTLLRSLPAYHALMEWYPLRDEVQTFIGDRGVAIFCHAISTEDECLLCSTYFRRDFAELGISLKDPQFSEKEELLESFGRQLARNSDKISDTFFDKLKIFFSQEEIVALVGFGVIMVATNLVNNTLKIEIDDNIKSYVNSK